MKFVVFSSPSVIVMIKSRKIRWARNISRLGEMINAEKERIIINGCMSAGEEAKDEL
jgi:hypothetical protein